MPLTPDERKRKLGFGALTKIAKRTNRTVGHVSQVNAEKRRDLKVERAITKAILREHPEISAGDVWPASYASRPTTPKSTADAEAHTRAVA